MTHAPTAIDADERYRRANVHPGEWKNPVPAGRYHLVVVGGGTAGLVSAAIAAGLGARVALVERSALGGDCLNVGCVPSKGLIRAARAWQEARRGADRFGAPAVAAEGDATKALSRTRRMRAALSDADSAARFRELGVDVYLGDATFTGADQICVRDAAGGQATLFFRRAIIATGGRPAVPPVDGLVDSGYLTNETIFELADVPASLLVIGGGAIGCELAQTFARLGSAVTVLNADARLLPRDDPDASRIIQRSLEADGVEVHQGARVLSARRAGDTRTLTFEVDGNRKEVSGEAVLVAAGRTPNTAQLGLEAAGVAFSSKGVIVNDRLRTTNRRIFAIGDSSSKYQFTHAADAQARLAVPNALFFGMGGGTVSKLVTPWCTYTAPEVAHVGMTAAEAAAAGDRVTTITVPLSSVDRAVLDDATDGFLRMHLARSSDIILGATLVSEHAGETISEITAAMTNGIGLAGLGKTIHPYPTQAEAIRKAADLYRRGKLTLRARRLIRIVLRLVR